MERIQHTSATTGGWSDTGSTTSGSGVISGLADTTGILVGEHLTVSAGFPSTTTPYLVTAKTADSVTVNEEATSSEVGVSVASLPNMFIERDPSQGARTIVTDDWANHVQEEIAGVIEAAGQTLDGDNKRQLKDSLRLLSDAHVHDGGSGVGHASKINLGSAAHVTGLLPAANFAIPILTGTFDITVGTTYFTVEGTGTCSWVKLSNVVFLSFPQIFGTPQASSGLRIGTVAATLPAEIVPAYGSDWVHLPFIIKNGGAEGPGRIQIIPHVAVDTPSNGFILMFCETTGTSPDRIKYPTGTFEDSGDKGFPRQTIVYSV